MAGKGRDPGRSVTSRVLAVLAAFDDSHPRLRLSEVARRSCLPVSTVSRLLAELVAGEALARRPDGRYEVGRRLWQLGLLAPARATGGGPGRGDEGHPAQVRPAGARSPGGRRRDRQGPAPRGGRAGFGRPPFHWAVKNVAAVSGPAYRWAADRKVPGCRPARP